MQTFNERNFFLLCDAVASKDRELKKIISEHGYPPMWTRPARFSTLIHIILEQQVSLASAKAAFLKLKERLGNITPKALAALTDEEMKTCYFSRQKMEYARQLAGAILSKNLQLKKMGEWPDEQVRAKLKEIKGIGDWTADIYLLFALQRTDIFPTGDLAMVNAYREVKVVPGYSKDEILTGAEKWRPYRSIATMLLWHHYIQKRGIKI